MGEVFIFLFVIVIIIGIIILIKFTKIKKKLPKKKKEFFLNNFKKISNEIDKSNQIIHFDKLYHKILIEIGYSGTFGEILKRNPKEISDINKIWDLHKLRNKLVHDFDLLENTVLNKRARDYRREVIKLFNKV